MASDRSLVLGGGGVTGIAWELGVVEAWLRSGVDVRTADLAIGTSAGSAVAAQLWSGAPVEELVARQLDASTTELLPTMDLDLVIRIFMEAAETPGTHEERCAVVGALALEAPTLPEAVRREIVAARLPSTEWSDRPLLITAVDCETGGFALFDRTKDVELVDAVAASCAIPGVWPPVTINGRRYMDGGVWSPTNAFLAGEHERVVVLSPLPAEQVPAAKAEVARLREAGADVLFLEADGAALAEMGPNPLDPAKRSVALEAGRRQGEASLDALRAIWEG